MDIIANAWKVPMKKGTKDVFLCKWKNERNWHKTINLNKTNGAIITGSANNIIVLDVDIKKRNDGDKIEGIQEFAKYTNEYGQINTFTVRSPSGGYHYYFKYENTSERAKYLIENYLKTSVGYRNAGLDVRSDGGVIIMPGSSTSSGSYNVINDCQLLEMPVSLIEWLLDASATTDKHTPNVAFVPSRKAQKEFQYIFHDITQQKVEDILKLLPMKYSDNYSDWLKATTILKRHNLRDLWERWSKNSKLYNSRKNAKIWDSIGAHFDINLLVSELRDMGMNIKHFSRYKPYTPITRDLSKLIESL